MTRTRFTNLPPAKETGAVYTPAGMAADLSSSIHSHLPQKQSISILEPAVGDGRLLYALLNTIAGNANVQVTAYEVDAEVLASTKTKLEEDFPHVSFVLINRDIIEDFLSGHLMGKEFDIIIANPPYLRTQIMGADKSRKLAKQFGLRGRLDIYYVFILLAIELLSDDGVAGFVTSNRFMRVKSGESLRGYLLSHSELIEVIDYGDTKLFDAAVLPCTFVFRRGKTDPLKVRFYSIYQTTDKETSTDAMEFPYHQIRTSPELAYGAATFDVQNGDLRISKADGTWSVGSKESLEWLEVVDSHTKRRLGQLGKIRVGIKTTADKVFIIKDANTFGEHLPELARPLVTHRNAGQIVGKEEPRWLVVYPHETVSGKRRVIPLEGYPKTESYLSAHREQLEGRKYVKDAGRQWYEIWVPQDPAKWEEPKIVFRDIADIPQFWLETSGAVINGDCYWLDVFDKTNQSLLFLALGVLNSSFITEYYDRRVNNKLYAGKRRFMTQYVEQFPLPSDETEEAKEIVRTVQSIFDRQTAPSQSEKDVIDSLVYACFGFRSKKSLGSGS
ncbi:MAG: Eco57I restriction-modification methylase domain-containing protein [Cutibacterium avidum]|nr:N-6 DNA methylase [Actinomycetaceae bacterium]MDU7387629.1 Eco57I restriction-modification methylase domain-containing protein [Cutibacterium avidum]